MANTGRYCDDEDKIPFQFVCTESVHKQIKSESIVRKILGLKENIAIQQNLFTPLLIIACKSEANILISSLETTSEMLSSVAFVFIENSEKELSQIERKPSIFYTSGTTDDILNKIDDNTLERIAFKTVLPIADTLQNYLQRPSELFQGEIV